MNSPVYEKGYLYMNTYEKFYLMVQVTNNKFMQCAPLNYKSIPVEERFSYFKGGNYVKNMPDVFVQIGGQKLSEIITGSLGLFLLSKALKDKLETSNIKGAEFVPVSIENKKGIRYNDYYAMIITGRASNADRKDSVAEYIENEHMWCDVGLLFPINSWDGTDIFYLEGSKASIK